MVARQKRNYKRIALGIVGALLIGIIAVALLALRTPGWYRPCKIAREDEQKVRKNLSDAEQAFTENLLAGDETFIYHIYQDDVNRWIAMRRSIYPLIDDLVPSTFADPFIRFSDGTITISGKHPSTKDVILSLDVQAYFENQAIVLKAGTSRCGSLPLPVSLERLGLAQPVDTAAGRLWPGSPRVSGDLLSGIQVAAQAWWQNGGMNYEVKGIHIDQGVLSLTIKPLGHHAREPRKTQASEG